MRKHRGIRILSNYIVRNVITVPFSRQLNKNHTRTSLLSYKCLQTYHWILSLRDFVMRITGSFSIKCSAEHVIVDRLALRDNPKFQFPLSHHWLSPAWNKTNNSPWLISNEMIRPSRYHLEKHDTKQELCGLYLIYLCWKCIQGIHETRTSVGIMTSASAVMIKRASHICAVPQFL